MKKEIIFGAIFALMLGACSTNDTPEPVASEPDLPTFEEITLPEASIDAISEKNIERSTDFALRILNAELDIFENNNLVISPVTIFSVFSMAVNGAGSFSKEPIMDLLGYGDADIKELNEFNYHVLTALPNLDPEKVTVELSNTYWVQKGLQILEPYQNTIEAYYYAEDGGTDQ